MANKVQVVIEGVGNFNNVINSVKGVQNSLNQLKIPQNLKGNLDNIFKSLQTDAAKAQQYLDQGFKNKSDVTAYSRLIDNISKNLNN